MGPKRVPGKDVLPSADPGPGLSPERNCRRRENRPRPEAGVRVRARRTVWRGGWPPDGPTCACRPPLTTYDAHSRAGDKGGLAQKRVQLLEGVDNPSDTKQDSCETRASVGPAGEAADGKGLASALSAMLPWPTVNVLTYPVYARFHQHTFILKRPDAKILRRHQTAVGKPAMSARES